MDRFPYHIFLLYSSENSKKIKDINTTAGDFSKYNLNKKKKSEKIFISNLNIQNVQCVQNCIITFVTTIRGSTQSERLNALKYDSEILKDYIQSTRIYLIPLHLVTFKE